MSSAVILVSIAYAASVALPANQISISKDVEPGKLVQQSVIAIGISQQGPKAVPLQKYGGADPHGDDPHGDDPHDEVHDKGLKSNEDEKARKAPKDVYGGQYPNTQAPY